MLESKDGSIWMTGEGGLARYFQGRLQRWTQADGLLSDVTEGLTIGAKGELWIGYSWTGSLGLDGHNFQNFTEKSGLPSRVVGPLAVDANNKLWIGALRGGGLTSYDGQQFHQFTSADGLPSNELTRLLATPGGVLWIGTSGGLCRLTDGKFTSYRKNKDRLLDNRITGLTQGCRWDLVGRNCCWCHALRWQSLVHPNQFRRHRGQHRLEHPPGSGRKFLVQHRQRPDPIPARPPDAPPGAPANRPRRQGIHRKDGIAEITAGRRTQFKWSVTDLRTRAATRRFRWQFADAGTSIDGGRRARGWSAGTSDTRI